MPIPAIVASILASLAVAAAGAGAAIANKKVQKKNQLLGRPQGAASEALFGKEAGPGGSQQFQNYTPEQQKLMSLLGGLGQTGVQNLIGQQKNSFAPIAQQAREGFNRQTIPGIAERFSALGSGGAQRSSAFANTLGQSASDLETNLASLGSQHGLQQQRLQQDLYNQLLGYGLKPQFETAIFGGGQGQQGVLGDTLKNVIPQIGEAVKTAVENRRNANANIANVGK